MGEARLAARGWGSAVKPVGGGDGPGQEPQNRLFWHGFCFLSPCWSSKWSMLFALVYSLTGRGGFQLMCLIAFLYTI